MLTYTIHLSNNFDADDPVDAVRQMIAYVIDNATHAGYRVDWDGGTTFVDADLIDLDEPC